MSNVNIWKANYYEHVPHVTKFTVKYEMEALIPNIPVRKELYRKHAIDNTQRHKGSLTLVVIDLAFMSCYQGSSRGRKAKNIDFSHKY